MRWTVADLALFPDPLDDTRHEIIGGELHSSKQPHWRHQRACDRIVRRFDRWDPDERHGVVVGAPGVVFSIEDAVAPDVVWIARERLSEVLAEDGKLRAAPDQVIEVLSHGRENDRRDRAVKRALYERFGVREYWVVDWRSRRVEVFRHEDGRLAPSAARGSQDRLTSPMLPGFSVTVEDLLPEDWPR